MGDAEQRKRVAEQICDRYPTSSVYVVLRNPIASGGICDAEVTDLKGKILAAHRVHYDPKGIITATDPPLPKKAA